MKSQGSSLKGAHMSVANEHPSSHQVHVVNEETRRHSAEVTDNHKE